MGGRGGQHEESIHKVGGLVWLIKSCVCVCVCVYSVENQLTQNEEGIYTCEQLNLGC